jgi:hypothetical protein
MFKRLSLLALLLLILAACTQAPQPYRHSRTGFDTTSLRLRDAGTVYIAPIEGVARPLAKMAAQTLAENLATRNIPSTIHTISQPPYQVRAQVLVDRKSDPKKIHGQIYWTLSDHSNKTIFETTQVLNVERHLWAYGDQKMIDALMEEAAERFAGYLQDKREREAVELAEREKDILITISGIHGAPGDGNTSLKRAMSLTLRQGGAVVTKTPRKGGFLLEGKVDVFEPFEGMQRIKIAWIISDAKGQELGRAQQQNRVEAGTFNQAWGKMAYNIARAALPGIAEVVERERTRRDYERSRLESERTAAPGRRNLLVKPPF